MEVSLGRAATSPTLLWIVISGIQVKMKTFHPCQWNWLKILRNCLQVDPKDRPHELNHLADQLINIYSHVMKELYQRQIPKAIELRADSLNNKALSLLDLGNEKDAETCWEAALQADLFHLPSTYNYGVRQWRQARISDETLLDQLERTGAAQAGSGAAVYLRSLVHLERGDHETYQQLALELKNILSEDFEYPNLSEQLADNKGTTCLKSLEIGPVTSMSVSRDGRTMAAVCQSDQLGVWDLAKGSMILRSQGYIELELPVVSVSSNGKLIAEGGFNTLRLWNRNGGNAKPFDIYDATPRSLMISPDNKSMVCGFVDGSVYIYDLHTLDFLDEVNLSPC